MAIIKAINSKSSIGKAINYVTKEEKTEEKLISGIDCNPKTALDEMKATKELYGKDSGRQYAHFIQSFNPKDNISPEKAHEIGKEFIESNDKFKGHEIIMATHKDKDHIHNHFIINSVNFETGLKLHTTKHEYQEMKDISNKLSKEHGLTVPEKSETKGKITSFNQNKYQAMKNHFEGKGKSYVVETAMAVKKAQEKAISKDVFIKEMDKQGYKTNWKDTSKHVTFINKETEKRVRLANLEKTFNDKDFTKENLINQFKLNNDKSNEWTYKDLQNFINAKIKEIVIINNAIENVKNLMKNYEWKEEKIENIQMAIRERSNNKYGLFEFKEKSKNQNKIDQLKSQLPKEQKQLKKENPKYKTTKKELRTLEEHKNRFEIELNSLRESLEKAKPQVEKKKTNIEKTRKIEIERDKKPKRGNRR